MNGMCEAVWTGWSRWRVIGYAVLTLGHDRDPGMPSMTMPWGQRKNSWCTVYFWEGFFRCTDGIRVIQWLRRQPALRTKVGIFSSRSYGAGFQLRPAIGGPFQWGWKFLGRLLITHGDLRLSKIHKIIAWVTETALKKNFRSSRNRGIHY